MTVRRTEARHPQSNGLHALAAGELAACLFGAQSAALRAIEPALPQICAAAQAGAAALGAGGKMAYAGAGSSGLMALADCLELPGTFGIPPDRVPMLFAGGTSSLLHMTGGVEDDPALAKADFTRAGLAQGDVVLCLAASGGTPYTLAIADLARQAGVVVVGIANVPDCPLLALADIAIVLDTGPELVTGSTRMGAGTAQKVALNILSVLVGVRLGHVHDGYMVNVTADNAKLIDRATRIVAEVAGISASAAQTALAASHGAVKAAILIGGGLSAEQASEALIQSHGHIGPHLSPPQNNRAKAHQPGVEP